MKRILPRAAQLGLTLFLVCWCLPAVAEVDPVEEMQLWAPDMPGGGEQYGTSIDVDGDMLIAGAYVDASQHVNGGSAYLYQRNPGGPYPWRPVRKLLSSDGEPFGTFGWAVAIDGDVAIVGAWGESRAYIYERDAGGGDAWGEVAKLQGVPGSAFGFSVAVDGDRVVVGAEQETELFSRQGAAYFYKRGPTGTWSLFQRVVASDPGTEYRFGSAVAIEGDVTVVGSSGYDFSYGAAYVFEISQGEGWTEVVRLRPSGEGGFYGETLGLSGETVVIGAHDEDHELGVNAGALYIIERTATSPSVWEETARIVASDGEQSDHFGEEVAIDGDLLVVGVDRDEDFGPGTGSIYVLERDLSGDWAEGSKFGASNAQEGDLLGSAIAIDGHVVAAGAVGVGFVENLDGAAYTFLLSPALWSSGTCPGEITLGAAGFPPETSVGLAWGPGPGLTAISGTGVCADTEIEIDQAKPIGVRTTDADGETSLGFDAPPAVCGALLQAIELVNCETSNVEVIDEVPDT